MKVTVSNYGAYDCGVYRIVATIYVYTNEGQWYTYYAGHRTIEEAHQLARAGFKRGKPVEPRNWTRF